MVELLKPCLKEGTQVPLNSLRSIFLKRSCITRSSTEGYRPSGESKIICRTSATWNCVDQLDIFFLIFNLMIPTCGYRSRSSWMCPGDGCGIASSYPQHISKSRCPKQITSILSNSLRLFDQTIALILELRPRIPFSRPDNLKIVIRVDKDLLF